MTFEMLVCQNLPGRTICLGFVCERQTNRAAPLRRMWDQHRRVVHVHQAIRERDDISGGLKRSVITIPKGHGTNFGSILPGMALNDWDDISNNIIGLAPAIHLEELPYLHGQFFAFIVAAIIIEVGSTTRIERVIAQGNLVIHKRLRHLVELLRVFLAVFDMTNSIHRPQHVPDRPFLAMGVLAVKADDAVSQEYRRTSGAIAVFVVPRAFFQHPANTALVRTGRPKVQPLVRHQGFNVSSGVLARCRPGGGVLGWDRRCRFNHSGHVGDLAQQFDRHDLQCFWAVQDFRLPPRTSRVIAALSDHRAV